MGMMEVALNPEKQSAEFHFKGGCTSCGGNVNVRVSPGGTWGYCAACHWLSRPLLTVEGDELRLQQRPAAFA